MKTRRLLSLLLGAALLLSCVAPTYATSNAQVIERVDLNGVAAVLGRSVEAPTLPEDSLFRLVSYQWYKGAAEAGKEAGSTFENATYFLQVTLRLKDQNAYLLTDDSYIRINSDYRELSCTVDADAGAITSLFCVPVLSPASVRITLPEFLPGENIAKALAELHMEGTDMRKGLILLSLYDGDELLGIGGCNAAGKAVFSDKKLCFAPEHSYRLTGTVLLSGQYIEPADVTVTNPEACKTCAVTGGAQYAGFSAVYPCPDFPHIRSITLDGVVKPVSGAYPEAESGRLICGEPELYSAAYWGSTPWYDAKGRPIDNAWFIEGRAYDVAIAITPRFRVQGLDAESAGAFPILINGVPAIFDSMSENTYIYTVRFIAEPGAPLPYTDVDSTDWFYPGVEYCYRGGLMNGTGDNRFSPGGVPTRAQLVTILYRMAGSPEVTYQGAFADVKTNQWYSNAIEWAAANGIVNGVAPGTFDPMGHITREQIATILYRYALCPKVDGDLSAFPDCELVHDYAENALLWATSKGLIQGIASHGVTNLAPQNSATRAQLATIILRWEDQ